MDYEYDFSDIDKHLASAFDESADDPIPSPTMLSESLPVPLLAEANYFEEERKQANPSPSISMEVSDHPTRKEGESLEEQPLADEKTNPCLSLQNQQETIAIVDVVPRNGNVLSNQRSPYVDVSPQPPEQPVSGSSVATPQNPSELHKNMNNTDMDPVVNEFETELLNIKNKYQFRDNNTPELTNNESSRMLEEVPLHGNSFSSRTSELDDPGSGLDPLSALGNS